MAETPSLSGRRILLVEDEYILADELRQVLEDGGATVLGPVPSVADAMALVEAERDIDGALLDLSLGDEMVFLAADALIRRGIPFVFTTGYERAVVPERYARVTLCEKPIEPRDLASVLLREIAA